MSPLTDARQPSDRDGHREAVLRTTADVFENAANQAEALAIEWPEFGVDVQRFVRLQERVSAAAVTVGHKPKVRR